MHRLSILAASFATLLAGSALAAPSATAPAGAPDRSLSFGPFGALTLYRPDGEPKSVAVFASGDGGWNLGVVGMAQALRDDGALVVGFSTPRYLAAVAKRKDKCTYSAADFEALSHYAQQATGSRSYRLPVLVGYSSGATLVYAALAQAPPNTFAGALSLGFCPDLPAVQAWCKGGGLASHLDAKGRNRLFEPSTSLTAPWTALQGQIDQVCDAKGTADFVAATPRAELVPLPKVGHGYSVERNWLPQYHAAFAKLTAPAPAARPRPASVADLPVIDVPSVGTVQRVAVLLSGDGGWAGIDRSLAEALAARGTAVYGLDSLQYFWNPRTPAAAAADLARLIDAARAAHPGLPVVLVGYSMGADVLPALVNRLPAATDMTSTKLVLVGVGDKASFAFHLDYWLGGDDPNGQPVAPELERIGASVLCITGSDDEAGPCGGLHNARVRAVTLPGGHHFGGDYGALADAVLGFLAEGPHG